jgi:NAD(P)-dependent dehydrogenase (short-subunit alcohol dehydrogenase family)
VLVTVASLAAGKNTIHFNDLQFRHRYSPFGAYQQSKLANLLFAQELARKAGERGWNIHSRAAHPGWAATSIVANGQASTLPKPLGLIEQDPWHGYPARYGPVRRQRSRTLLYAALAPQARDGDYYGPQAQANAEAHPARPLCPPQPARPAWPPACGMFRNG